jgi:hypothetical protein
MMTYNVDSTNVKTIGYEADSQKLEVEYLSGQKYEYSNVPQNVFDGFITAVSKGKYLNQIIKGQYEVRRVI